MAGHQISSPLGQEDVCPNFALTVTKFVFSHSDNFRAKTNLSKPRSCPKRTFRHTALRRLHSVGQFWSAARRRSKKKSSAATARRRVLVYKVPQQRTYVIKRYYLKHIIP